MECYNCGNIGHSIKSCPKLDCKKCGATGHFAKECQNAPNQFKPRSNTAQGASFASGSAASAEAPKVWSQPSQAVAKQNKSLLSFFCEKLLGAGHSALLADQMMITWKMAGHNEETLKTLVFKENPKTQAQLRLALVKELSNVKAGHIPRSVNVSSLLDETVNYFMPNSDFGTWTDASRSNSGYFDGTLRLQAGTEQRQQQQPPPPNFQSSRPENFGNNFVGSGGQQPPSQPQGMSSFFHPGDNRQPNPTSFRSQPQVKEEQQDDDEIQIIHQSLPPSRDQMRPMQSSAGGGPQIPGPASILDLETALQNINSLERFKQLDETIQRETRQDPQLLNEFEGRHQSLAPLQKFVASRMRVMSDMFGMSESYIFTVSSTIQKLMAHVGLCLFTLKRMFMTYGRESLQDTIEEKLRPYSHSFPKGITVKYIVNMVNDFLLEFSRN